MSCADSSNCTCGCCAGIAVETPQGEQNPPGQPAIVYRTGTWANFKRSMLARLSSANYPALAGLKTRDDNDLSIALLDASAVVMDILTFYQERLANESYLRTATQLQSLTELARLIGYQPVPGIAALTYLAFTLKAPTGQAANPTTQAITIPAGTQVQSVPAQGQSPQTFETSSDIAAKPDWNALPVQTGIPWVPNKMPPFSAGMYIAGTATQLNVGDSLLILGIEREQWDGSSTIPPPQWDVVALNEVVVDQARNITFVGWDERLVHVDSTGGSVTWTSAKVFAFRQRAALFGNNAPDPNLFASATTPTKTSLPNLIDDSSTTGPWKWKNFTLPSNPIKDLDAVYSKIVVGGWFALRIRFQVQLFFVAAVETGSRSDFGISAKITRLAPDFWESTEPTTFPLAETAVLAQTEQLAVAEQPLNYPLYGAVIELADWRPDLVGVKAVAITGKAQKIEVNEPLTPLVFTPDDDSGKLSLQPGDLLTLLDPAPLPLDSLGVIPDWLTSTEATTTLALRVVDTNGRTGTVNAELADFILAASSKTDPTVQEFGVVSSVLAEKQPYPHTKILLANPLLNCYDRTVTAVNANVGMATAGRSVSEVMGNGSAATPNQSFTLRQSPLTYVQSPTPTGRQSTLVVRANGVAWNEVPTLYQQPGTAAVFSTVNHADATTDTVFGDGVEGATLPTGQNNIQATYRVGSGLAGNVGAGAITTLVDRPLGVSGVTNPSPATGGQDAQSIDDERANAPLSVLTLGRAVSIADYENFAASFAGIAKAQAVWIGHGPGRGLFLTVAAAGGVALPPGNGTLANLVTALQDYGNPLIPIHAVTYLETLFQIEAAVAYDPAYDVKAVKAGILSALQYQYSFGQRSFGQGVSGDEVGAFVQAVPGVVAVNVSKVTPGATSAAGDLNDTNWSLYRYQQWLSGQVTVNRPASGSPTWICPWSPVADPKTIPHAAEILVIDPNPKGVVLGVMP